MTTSDPFFFDQERLQTIADKPVLQAGLEDHREKRVLDIDQDGELLWGRVEGTVAEEPHDVEVRLAADGLVFACDCDGGRTGTACRHAVALLLRYADEREETDQLLTAEDNAIKERVKRGRQEVEVEPLSGELWFGGWRARSLVSASHFPRSYQVTIRSLSRRANLCTCPDFAVNQLGTCKHIEAVLHKIRKHPQYERFREQPAPLPYVWLSWEADDPPQILLHRSPAMGNKLAALLDRYFDAAGRFTGRLPDDFFRFLELVEERDDLHVGDDAREHVRHLAAASARRVRTEEIQRRIRASRRIPGVKARLYPYQVEGVAFLAGTGRALLADDMGLGKTLQAIAAAVWLREFEAAGRVLIVCPASLKQQWAREINKFTGLEAQVVQGPPPERGVQYRRQTPFVIVNYELLLRDLSVINDTVVPDLVILDEAQRIKNWRTKIAAAVKLIPSRYAFVLSGTPLENRLEDLYSLMQVVDPKILGPLWRYMIDFHVTDQRGKVLGYRNLAMLRQRLKPVMLRRDRSVVSDQLPERITSRLDVEMTAKQRELHNDALRAAGRYATIARKRPLTPTEQNKLMAALQSARMACNAAGLVDKETEGSPKIDELAVILEEVCLQSGLKAVVFSQWEAMTRMVESRLRRLGIGYVRLHGGVPTAKRGALLDRFREDDAVQVFLSTDAGGVGLNLQSGSVLVNLDVPWNPAVLEQRNARIHRLGQSRTVQVITMVAADSYEEHVLSLVQGKQDLFDQVVAEEAAEDVVAVSKKLVAALIDDLQGREPQVAATEELRQAGTEETPAAEEVEQGTRTEEDGEMQRRIAACLTGLQEAFGARIERVLGVGRGLIAILDQVADEDEGVAERLSQHVPVALIDQRTLAGLERLGAASPMAGATVHYDVGQQGESDEPVVSRLARLAAEKLTAARTLLEQQCAGGALELLVSALLAALADRAGRKAPVSRQEAGVWLYGEAVPQDLVTTDQAALVMRAVGLEQAPAVPDHLVAELCRDVTGFVGGTAVDM